MGLGRQNTSLRRTAGAAEDGATKYGNTLIFMRSTMAIGAIYDILTMVKDRPGTVQNRQPLLISNLCPPLFWGAERLDTMSAPALINSEAEREPVTRMAVVRPKTVLCVDDEKIGLRVRKIMLESRGFAVLTASNGPEGLKVFEENHVDLVVLDYFMPDVNGGEVASEMRRRRPGVPIVFLSAYFSLPPEALEVADAFITKGDPPDVLIDKIQNLL